MNKFLVFVFLSLAANASAPEPGVTERCKVIEVHDGDTITVEVVRRMRIRMLDCWAPEVTGPQKDAGIKSRDNLRSILNGKEVVVQIPFVSDNIGDSTSMGRILGRVWVDGKDASVIQVSSGNACKTKDEEIKKFGPMRKQ